MTEHEVQDGDAPANARGKKPVDIERHVLDLDVTQGLDRIGYAPKQLSEQ